MFNIKVFAHTILTNIKRKCTKIGFLRIFLDTREEISTPL